MALVMKLGKLENPQTFPHVLRPSSPIFSMCLNLVQLTPKTISIILKLQSQVITLNPLPPHSTDFQTVSKPFPWNFNSRRDGECDDGMHLVFEVKNLAA